MARSIKATNLETRTARLKLAKRRKPYWKLIDRDCYVGYYRGAKGGAWIARRHLGESKYIEQKIGTSDDTHDSDGTNILNFFEAQALVRKWFIQSLNKENSPQSGPCVVVDVAAEYLDWFKHNRKSYGNTKQIIDRDILPHFGTKEVERITTKEIKAWHHKLANTPRRTRAGVPKNDARENTPSEQRQRKSTANRLLTVLKAILNYAFNEGYVENDIAWRRVKPFRNVDSPKVRYLNRAERLRLTNACNEDFRLLVTAALLTGARYGELSGATVGDFDANMGTLFIPDSKNGKDRYITLNIEGIEFFSQQTAGRDHTQLIFTHADGSPWLKSHQTRRLKEACNNASIFPAISFHILRHTYASMLAMQGTSLQVIAQQLGHADTRTCERHYAHLCPSYVAETVKRNLPELGLNVGSNVIDIQATSI